MTPILFVIDNLQFGGGERLFLQIARALAADAWGITVAAHSGDPFERSVRAAGASFVPVDMSSRLGLGAIAQIGALARAQRFAIVHSQGARADFFTRLALTGLRSVRHVCTVQMPVEGFDVGPLRKRVYHLLDRATARRVDRFIVVSEALRRRLVHDRGVEARRVTLIPNGVELDGGSPRRDRAEVRRELAVADDVALVGAVGRLVWQKGLEHLVDAMPALLHRVPTARLLVVGEGPLRPALQARARAVADRVTFTGFRLDVARILPALDAVAVPSLQEGFPMITLEAMAAGRPIVATAIEGIAEQIQHGVEGLLVPPGDAAALADALAGVLMDRALGERLGQSARQRAMTTFDVRTTVANTCRVYVELLSAASSASPARAG